MIATLSRIRLVVGAGDQLLLILINQFTEYVAVPGPMMLVYIHSAIAPTTLLGLAMINVLGRRCALFISLSGLIRSAHLDPTVFPPRLTLAMDGSPSHSRPFTNEASATSVSLFPPLRTAFPN